MTPEQALQVLEQATSQLQATRVMHQQILQALQVLQKALQDKPKE